MNLVPLRPVTRALVLVLLVGVLAVVSACGSSAPVKKEASSAPSNSQSGGNPGPSTPGKVYKVGAIFPLSGTNAVYGDMFRKATDLGAKQVNTSGNLKGKLELVYEDSQAQPQPAVVAMNKLVNVDKVPFVFTAISSVVKAAAPIGNRSKVLMLNGGAISPDLAQLGEYMLSDIPLAHEEVGALLPYVYGDLGLKSMVIVHMNETVGNGVAKVIQEDFPKLGGKVLETFSIETTAKDFQAEVTKIRAANPDAVYIVSAGQQEVILTKQLRDGGVKAQILSYSAYNIADIMNLPEARGAIFTSEKLNWDGSDKATKDFVDGFKQAYNETPNYYQANWYNGVLILTELIRRLEEKNLEVTGENLLKALQDNRKFQVAGTQVEFQSDGTVKMPMQLNQVKDAKIVVIK